MSMEDLEKAFFLIKENFTTEECIFSGPKEDNLINLAEKILDVHFPKTYKEFIKKVGFGGPDDLIISGIRVNNPEELETTGVVWGVLKDRKDFGYPKHLIEIDDVGEGTAYCLDTSQMNEEGECPVVAWPIDGYESNPKLEIIAPDFGKFFLDMVKLRINWKNN